MTTKSAAALKAIIQSLLKNKGVQTGLGAAAGLGGAAVENRTLLNDSDAGTKGINSVMGAATGAMLPHSPMAALGGLTFKQLGLGALNTYQKDAPLRDRISKTNLAASQAAERTAQTNLDTANIGKEQAGKWSNGEKALAALAAAGVLGAGTYAASSIFGGKKKHSAGAQTVGKGDEAMRKRQKVRFDVPVGALPPEFFNSLATVDQNDERPAKRACLATRSELLAEIEEDAISL
jgi:hypothetical protein